MSTPVQMLVRKNLSHIVLQMKRNLSYKILPYHLQRVQLVQFELPLLLTEGFPRVRVVVDPVVLPPRPMVDATQMSILLLEKDIRALKDDMRALRKLVLVWCIRDLIINAGEIWKWSLQKRGDESGDGKHLYDTDPNVQELVFKVAVALKMQHQIPAVQQSSQTCITVHKDLPHFPSLRALDDAVRSSEFVIRTFPTLRNTHPVPCIIIDHYWRIRQHLSDTFKD